MSPCLCFLHVRSASVSWTLNPAPRAQCLCFLDEAQLKDELLRIHKSDPSSGIDARECTPDYKAPPHSVPMMYAKRHLPDVEQ